MTRVKLCGLRRTGDAQAANACMPDYAGFVFAPSRRRVDEDAAARLREALDPRIAAVGVFVNQDISWIAGLCARGVIQAVQLHGDEPAEDVRALQRLTGCPVIKAVGVGDSPPPLPADPDYLLFDTLSPARGGTGDAFDWSLLQGVDRPYFLAGGLDADNVAGAVATLRPFAVDVSSGVETDGWKDAAKMAAFVEAARRA